MSCHVVLCCVVLCRVVLCCVVLCCVAFLYGDITVETFPPIQAVQWNILWLFCAMVVVVGSVYFYLCLVLFHSRSIWWKGDYIVVLFFLISNKSRTSS